MNKKLRRLYTLALVGGLFGARPALSQEQSDGYKLPRPTVSAAFPNSVRYVEVEGNRVAYVDVGEGPPVIFIHGNPTSSFLWRNVLPYVEGAGRVIALDLPGMGRSSKPRRALRFVDQAGAFDGFVERLGLRDITLVGHDWGASIVFDYARRHPENVRGIAFMEGVLPPIFPLPSFEAMGEEMGEMFRAFKDPVKGRSMLIDRNMFVEEILPEFINRPLGDEALDRYRAPFIDPADREAVLMWPRELPIAGEPADVVERMEAIRRFMSETAIPMLLLYAEPGVVVPPALVEWYTGNITDIETAFVGQGFHFIQEDQPGAIGRELNDWIRRRIRPRR